MLTLNSTKFQQFDSTSNHQFSNHCKLNFTVTLLTDEQKTIRWEKWMYLSQLFDKYIAYKKFNTPEAYDFFMRHFSLTVDYDHATQLVNDTIDVYYNDPTMSENTLRYKEILLRQYKYFSFTHLANIYVTCGKLPDSLQSVFNEMILELM